MSTKGHQERCIFSPEEVAELRSTLDGFRRGPGFTAGKWKVSDANRDPAVVGERPKRVKVRDITLRVSEQMSDVALSAEQRLELLGALVASGVPALETSSFGRGHSVDEMRRETEAAKGLNPECEILYGSARGEADMQAAADSGVDAVRVLSGTFLGGAMPAYAGAVYHRAWQQREWKTLNFPREPADVTQRAQRLVELGVAHGLKVGGTVLLLSYATDEDVAQYCRGIADAGAFEVQLGDHASGTGPEAFAHFVRVAKEAAPELEVCAHTHDMFGLATAACLTSALAGAETVEASINGFTEGPAQGDLAQVVAGLEMLYGIDTGIDLTRLTPLARLAERLCGLSRPGDWGIVGREVFDFGNDGDEYAQELKVDPLIHMGVAPDAVGNQSNLRIGVTSGPFTMWDKLDELGIEADAREVEEILAACKDDMRVRHRGLDDDELRKIAESTLNAARRTPSTLPG
jgi:isopropylmalate/homocitrate/citramalate synthase